MPTQFDDLPFELREKIFHIALFADWEPRVVEIFFKNGEIYSKTRPPPLLQVCQLSRDVTLKKYKPWLLRFKGTLAHEPYEKLVEERGWKNLSRLNNVCIDLHFDMLVIKTQQWSPWNFGKLEREALGSLAVNLGGLMNWPSIPQLVRRFTNLRTLKLFDGTKDDKMLHFKRDHIEREIQKMFWKRKTVPKVVVEEMPGVLEWEGGISDWYVYKHPKRSRSSRNRGGDDHDSSVPSSITMITTIESRTSQTSTQGVRKDFKRYHLPPAYRNEGTRSRTSSIRATATTTSSSIPNTSSHNPRKRVHDNYEGTQAPDVPRKASKKSHRGHVPATTPASCSLPSVPHIPLTKVQPRKFIVPQVQDIINTSREPSPTLKTIQEAFAGIWEALELARSPSPNIDPTSHTPRSTVIEINENDLLDLVDPSSTPQVCRPKDPGSPIANFKSPFIDWDDLEMGFSQEDLRAELPGTSSSTFSYPMHREDLNLEPCDTSAADIIDLTQEGPDYQSQAEFVDLTQESEMDDDLPALTWTQSTITQTDIETVQLEDLEIESTRRVDSELINNSSFASPDDYVQKEHIWISSLPELQVEVEQYVVERILEERTTPEGIQFLVQWARFPDEGDWSWNSENMIMKIAPDLVMTWMLAKNDTEAEAGAGVGIEGVAEESEPIFQRDVEVDVQDHVVEETQPSDERPASAEEPDPEEEVLGVEVELDTVNADDIPERILGKRKFKGVPHYLVKWEGYELVKDRTWEPCERLGVDAPWLVETFEARKVKTKRK